MKLTLFLYSGKREDNTYETTRRIQLSSQFALDKDGKVLTVPKILEKCAEIKAHFKADKMELLGLPQKTK